MVRGSWAVIVSTLFLGMPAAGQSTGDASLELRQRAKVYKEKSKRSQMLGTLPRKARVPVTTPTPGPGCKRGWLAVAPKGFICAKTRAIAQAPDSTPLPTVKEGRALPYAYGRLGKSEAVLLYKSRADVLAGLGEKPDKKMDLRLKKRLRIAGKRYWRTDSGYVEAVHVREFGESKFAGESLVGRKLPVAWARPIERGAKVKVRSAATLSAPVVAELPAKSLVDVKEIHSGGLFVRVGQDQWIERKETRIAQAVTPPTDTAPDETWVDIDVDEQTVVVYRGTKPLYGTMVSTGVRKRRTPLGSFRITRKHAIQSMYSTATSKDKYKVSGVPWIMYFSKVYAMHGAYWHDRFGARRSHGCINLAPRDARAIYNLVEPAVPPGWSSAQATDETRGSLIRIRGSR